MDLHQNARTCSNDKYKYPVGQHLKSCDASKHQIRVEIIMSKANLIISVLSDLSATRLAKIAKLAALESQARSTFLKNAAGAQNLPHGTGNICIFVYLHLFLFVVCDLMRSKCFQSLFH